MPAAPERPCCPVGARGDVAAIDAALRLIGQPGAESLSAIALRLGIAKSSLHGHRKQHLAAVQGDPEQGTERNGTPLNEPLNGTTPVSAFHVPNPGDDPTTAPRRLITATLERDAIKLRIKGKSYEAIGDELGCDPGTAMDAVERVLLRTRNKADEQAEMARSIEVRRCDAIIESFWERATDPGCAEVKVPADNEQGYRAYDGQDKAADRLLKAMERRAKLLGLDAPTNAVQVTIVNNPAFQEVIRVLFEALSDHHEVRAIVMAKVGAALQARRGQPRLTG